MKIIEKSCEHICLLKNKLLIFVSTKRNNVLFIYEINIIQDNSENK